MLVFTAQNAKNYGIVTNAGGPDTRLAASKCTAPERLVYQAHGSFT